MPVYLLNPTYDRLEVNALFIQPTRWCANSCKNCYVKARKSEEFHTPWEEQVELFKLFYLGKKAWANQITLSLDTRPNTVDQRVHMANFFASIYHVIKEAPKNIDRPQVHVTVRDIYTLRDYKELLNQRDLSLLTVASISNFTVDDIQDLREVTGMNVHINWNCMPPSNVNSSNLEKHVEKFISIGKAVNSIYMIVHKTPLGKPRNDLVKLGDRSRWRSDVLYMKTMLESVPSNIRSKIQIDGCLQDVIRGEKSDFGCSSNISRFQVWPDGSVSGCPYSFDSNTDPGRTADDILENIRKTKKAYDYDRCHLPEIHHSLIRRPTDSR